MTSEKIGVSGVTSTLGTWYGGVVMDVLLSFYEAAILYRDFNSTDYYLVTCSQRRLVCADVCSARTSWRYQNRKFTIPSLFGIVGAANW